MSTIGRHLSYPASTALALANAAGYLHARVSSDADPDEPTPEESAEMDRYLAERNGFVEWIGGGWGDLVAQTATVETLQSSGEARREALEVVREMYGDGVFPLDVHGFGEGWRSVPRIVLRLVDDGVVNAPATGSLVL